MTKPSTEISAADLFLKMMEARPSDIIDFPRRGADGNYVARVRIQVLRGEDHDRARMAGQAALKRKIASFGIAPLSDKDMESPAIQECLGDAIAHELLAMAVRSVEPVSPETETAAPVYGPIFTSGALIPQALTADEIAALYNAYLMVQHKYGPFERTIDGDADVDAWVNRLEEGAARYPLAVLPLPQLAELTCSLAERISTLSRILASQWESLPDSSRSLLHPFCMGIGSFGEQRASATLSTSLASSPEVTIEQALRMTVAQKAARENF